MIIGITGGIGCGKSIVTNKLKNLGQYVIDADLVAREIVTPGSSALNEIIETFGKDILNKDNTLNRTKLGNIVFNDKDKLSLLNKITHPKIHDAISQTVKENISKYKIIFIDAALLYENKREDDFDKIIVVAAALENRIKWLEERDNISKEGIERKMNCQIPLEDKIEKADVVINNNSTVSDLEKKTEELLIEFKKNFQ